MEDGEGRLIRRLTFSRRRAGAGLVERSGFFDKRIAKDIEVDKFIGRVRAA
jgi:hypothetical protein